MLRVDGGIPYEVLEQLDGEELLQAWDEFVAYCEERNEQTRAQVTAHQR